MPRPGTTATGSRRGAPARGAASACAAMPRALGCGRLRLASPAAVARLLPCAPRTRRKQVITAGECASQRNRFILTASAIQHARGEGYRALRAPASVPCAGSETPGTKSGCGPSCPAAAIRSGSQQDVARQYAAWTCRAGWNAVAESAAGCTSGMRRPRLQPHAASVRCGLRRFMPPWGSATSRRCKVCAVQMSAMAFVGGMPTTWITPLGLRNPVRGAARFGYHTRTKPRPNIRSLCGDIDREDGNAVHIPGRTLSLTGKPGQDILATSGDLRRPDLEEKSLPFQTKTPYFSAM